MPVPPYSATDAQLSAQLKKWTGGTPAVHPVGELLDRHWAAAFAYARLCTDTGRAAGMLTTAAFTRLFGEALRQDGPSSAWRPHLLVTVGRIAAEWDADGRRELLHPALRTTDHASGPASARLLPPSHRQTLAQAFQRMPQTARCVLWHAEVEAEPPLIPAALLGLDEETARIELQRARERLRAEVLQVHRESAPDEECRRFLRLLDVTYRRGGTASDRDLRRHLDRCGHCRYTADQLAQFHGSLGFALAEAVLGWAARDYVTARLTSALGESDAQEAAYDGTDAAPETAAQARFGTAEAWGPDPEAGPAVGAAGAWNAAGGTPDSGAAGTAGAWGFTGPEAGTGTGGPAQEWGPAADPARAAAATTASTPGHHAADPAGPAPHPAAHAADAPADRRRTGPAPRWRAAAVSAGRRVAERAGDRLGALSASLHGTGSPSGPGAGRNSGGPRVLSRRAVQRARAVRRRNLALAVSAVSGLIALPLVLWSAGADEGDGGNGNGAKGGQAAGTTPGSATATESPSWIGSGGTAKTALVGRLHNTASGLCVDIAGGRPGEGAETRLATCSPAAAQQWSYDPDGLLRSVAAPTLCLDSRLGYSVRLAPCAGAGQPGGKEVRYDFTLQGVLIPRGHQDLALTPAATDGSGALVLKNRADDPAQRWTVDTSAPELQMAVVTWGVGGG
ncbi:ricin-type beta-trefoil lectin domain protein [Streptomyces thermocoprophilus]|uniref:Ricin-type beta-trefoil lectin domain protein n=1 Tax=Streptomyces thermocoprophilus TaxID=78356 RepID=A0ABV5V7M3_9ACTN